MQNNRQFFPQKAAVPFAMGNGYMPNALPCAFDVDLPPSTTLLKSLNGFEFQPTEVCPKNFIIFNQSENRSQVMFHPAVAQKMNCHGIPPSTCIQGNFYSNNRNIEKIEISGPVEVESDPLEEDSEDINALLSSDEEEEEDNDDEVSTAQSYGNCGSNSPDSHSTAGSKMRKIRPSSSIQKSACSGSSCNSDPKRLKMKRMVKALQGIVPGGNQMNTVAVLDEAVKYLKSLKVEVQKLGVGNLQ